MHFSVEHLQTGGVSEKTLTAISMRINDGIDFLRFSLLPMRLVGKFCLYYGKVFLRHFPLNDDISVLRSTEEPISLPRKVVFLLIGKSIRSRYLEVANLALER